MWFASSTWAQHNKASIQAVTQNFVLSKSDRKVELQVTMG